MTTAFSVDKLYRGSGNSYKINVVARRVGRDVYSARLDVGPDGGGRLFLLRNYVEVASAADVRTPLQPGRTYRISVRAEGTSPTMLSAKVWADGQAEPDWQLRGQDSLAGLQSAGVVGVGLFVPGSTTNAPVTMAVEDFRATTTSAAPAPAPAPVPAPAPAPDSGLGPVSYPSVEAMRRSGRFRIPSDANLVMWRFGDQSLEEVFMSLASNDILVLPERAQPYRIDSSGGFRAADVSAVLGQGGRRLPVESTFRGRPARTWFAMARAQRGVIGLGPGAVIEPTASGFRQEPQIEDKGSPIPGGGSSPGRYWFDLQGQRRTELVGAQEKLLESGRSDAYFGNFTLRGRDFGGVAYSGIGSRGGTFERLGLDGAWRGFSGVPNGETAALSVNRGRYLISRVSMKPLDAGGRRIGTSPVMINSSPGGRWEHGDVSQARFGMPTLWGASGRHDFVDVTSRWGAGPGVNVEQAREGFELVWTGGRIWPNRGNAGGHPAPDGIYGNSLHVGFNATGRASIRLVDVDLDRSVQQGKLCIQLYGMRDTSLVSARATQNGRAVPVVGYGPSGPVPMG
ncbi:hypothetical protein [Nocardioides marmoraquaticus]